MLQKKWFCCPYTMCQFCSSFYHCHPNMRMSGNEETFIDKDESREEISECDVDANNNSNDTNIEASSEDFSDSRSNLDVDIYLDAFRAPQNEIDQLLKLLAKEEPNIYKSLTDYGINRRTSDYLLRLIIGYVLDNAEKYSGSENQKVNAIAKDFEKRYSYVLSSLVTMGIPRNRLNELIKKVIRFTLNNAQISTEKGWSKWEDLGGILTSGPGSSSWGPNRLDVFVKGSDNAMYHKWWNGSRWSDFENLGGVLTSAPASVSWGPNRIDTFVRGTDNAMYHKWWNGSRWSDYENLGGILTSAPGASSWGPNRIDTFVRGTDNQLYHKWWNGSRWSDWEALGGNLTSGPAAVSWGPNRIDVFARGQNQALWHKWWDGSRWSDWEDLGGNIASEPAAVSTRPNRIDVFARGKNGELIYKSWNGSRWSSWQNLDGNLTSAPASASWGPNRIDVFAKGKNDHLWHLWKE